MKSLFSKELSRWLERKEINRKDFIALMQTCDYSVFNGLDAITLSRWLNGKSTPPLYKQLLIAKNLKIELMDVIYNLTSVNEPIPEKHLKWLIELTRILDYSINILSYNSLLDFRVEITDISKDMYDKLFSEFYHNISSLSSWNKSLQNISNKIRYKAILVKNDHNNVIGHWVFIEDIYPLSVHINVLSEVKDIEESVFIALGYFNSSDQLFEIIVNAACYYLLKLSHKKRYALIHVTYQFLDFCTNVFGADIVHYHSPKSNTPSESGIYLVKIDIIKAISRPIAQMKIQSRISCLKNCEASCNKCNLRKI